MKIQSKQIQRIALDDLLIDLLNPRYDPMNSQQEVLATIAKDQGTKLVNLADDIVDNGLNPSDLPIVMSAGEINKFIVLEGNRRIAALKLVSSTQLLESLDLPTTLVKRYKAIHARANTTLPKEIDCVILSREDANDWIRLKHTGENDGVGVLSWDGRARHRFRGSSPALQAIELVEKSHFLDEGTKKKLPKIAITNIERILVTPDARKHLGVDVKNRQLILKSPKEEAVGRLAIVISDVANRQIKVTDLDTKGQRIDYAKDVASRHIPTPYSKIPSSGGITGSASELSKSGRRIGTDRSTLIPKQMMLKIQQPRINKIYYELQKLNIEKFINSCAVLLRVFVEMSVDEFARRHKISLDVPIVPKSGSGARPQKRDMKLSKKIETVASYMENKGLCNKNELLGVRSLINNRNHVLSVESWNAYVHNQNYSPTPADLKVNWDNIQVFIERIWAT